ncbi:MAG: acireductone synthase [Gammaproteobacteria bacterium]|nr:acireductone synthase [Gammaproteobacteria bacterium]
MIKAIVTDIEGTTSSLSFVKDILFPYARKHMGEYVRCHAEEDRVAALINDVRLEAGESLSLDDVVLQLEQWIDEDKKVTPLKALQGLLWETGYQQGDFKGHIYDDAKLNLEKWQQQGLRLYVYSSGSVYAQKLLFGFTEYGDLNVLFSGYFDTKTGAKTEAGSYRKIADEINLSANEVLFLSDIEAELDAAKEAGMNTCWLVRDGSIDVNAAHLQVKDFNEVTSRLF